MALLNASREVINVVNSCLKSLGIAKVTVLDSSHPLVSDALDTYQRSLSQVQLTDWWFNRSYKEVLLPNAAGEIELPINTISCDPVNPHSHIKMVKLDNVSKLYDARNNTYVMGAQTVIIRKLLDFDELPLAAQHYIEARAVLDFFDEQDGDEKKVNRYAQRVMEALTNLQEEDMANADPNNLNTARQLYVRSRFSPVGRTR